MLKNNIYTSFVSITDELGNVVGDITGKDGVVKIRNLDLGTQLSSGIGSAGATGLSGDRFNTLTQSVLISPIIGSSLTFTVDTDLSYLQGNLISVTNTGNINNNFKGSVLSYTKSTGVLVCGNIKEINGTFSVSSVYNINIHFSNFADNLITNTLMSMPPAPTVIELTAYSTSTEIGFAIQNPARVPFGNILIPYIDRIKITLGNNNNVTILDNNINIPSTNLDIRGIVLSKIGASGRMNKSFNQQSLPVFVHTDPNISDYKDSVTDKYIVNIWFNNTLINGTPNVLTVTLDDFMTAFPPSSPLNLSVDSLTQTTSALSWNQPIYNSGNINDSSISISDYKIDYINTNTPSRYPVGGYTTGTSSYVTSTSLNKTLSSLLPGTNYTVTIAAKNNVNPSYGATDTITFSTLNPLAPPNITNLPLTLPSSHFNVNIKRVSDGSIINVPIYLSSVNVGNLPLLTNLPIHSTSKIGSTGTGLMTLRSYLNNVLNQTVSFNGFTTTGYTSSTSINAFTFNSITIGDYYTNPKETNFYKICSSIIPVLNQTNIALTLGTLQSVKVDFSRLDGETVTSDSLFFYLDDLSKLPSVSTLNITDSFTSRTVTGIPVVGSLIAQNVTYTTSINNFARYFYRRDKIYSLSSSDPGVSVTINSVTSLPNNVPYPIGIDTDYNLSGSTTVSFVNGNNSLGINLIGTVYSPYTASGSSASRSCMIYKILDTLTYNKLDVSPSLKLSKTAFIPGHRVKTPELINVTPSPTNFQFTNLDFDNSVNLLTVPYKNELPIIKGSYKTRATEASYLSNIKDYGGPDYTLMNGETDFRYSTFSWNVDMEESSTINKLQFQFSNFNANSNVTRQTSISSINGDGKFVVYYRFVEFDDSGNYIPPQDTSDTPTVLTSYWVNANINGNNFTGFCNKPANNGSLGGLIFSDNDASPINTPESSSFTYNVLTHSFLPKTSGKKGLKIYMMVGVKMDANITFSDVSCKYW